MKRNRQLSVAAMEFEITLDLPRRQGRKEGTRKIERPAPTPRTPRVTRLMALAVRYQGLVDGGELRDYADIARLGYVTRARVTQVMNLSNLAPDIQENLLFPDGFLPPERRLRKLAAQVDWDTQRRLWRELLPGLKRATSAVLSADLM
jgi:hypothetical protein